MTTAIPLGRTFNGLSICRVTVHNDPSSSPDLWCLCRERQHAAATSEREWCRSGLVLNDVSFWHRQADLHFPNLRGNRLRGKAPKSAIMRAENHRIRPTHQSSATGLLRVCWLLVRMPALNLVLTATGVLGNAAALILRLSGALPHFPFWGMLGFSIGAFLLLTAYHILSDILTR